jgi:hypothetical protein
MSKKEYYLPRADNDKNVWINNLNSKLGTYAATLGLSAADITALNNDTLMFTYLINVTEIITNYKKLRVDHKNLLRDGPIGAAGGAMPAAPALPSVPTAVAPGIFPRVTQLVQRIKTNANYTEAIGKDLGIVGSQQMMNATEMKPTIKLVFKGGQVEVQWVKGDADAIRIETDKGTGTWQFLAVDTIPHYTDTAAITGPAVWKYRAMYLLNDELVGQWSDMVSIAVG